MLITGASGFLASYMQEECRRAGYDVLGVDRKPNDNPNIWAVFGVGSVECLDLEGLCAGFDIRTIFHLAGGASVPLSMQEPVDDCVSLLPGTVAVAHFARQRRATLVMFSSAAVYGNPCRLPAGEEDPRLPISPYGIHKLLAESLLENYSRVWNLSVRILRVFSAYGPGLRRQIFWDIATRAIECVRKDEKTIRLFGTGTETRDFLHARDVARAALIASTYASPQNIAVYNVASGEEIEVGKAVSYLLAQMGVELSFEYDGVSRPGDPLRWQADISRLKALGFYPEIPLNEGLREVAHWIENVHLVKLHRPSVL